jgi:hypothetical protein
MRKKTIAFLMALAVFLGMSARVCAAELPDVDRRGSLVIRMEYDGEPLDSGALTLYRVGEIRIHDGNADFVLVDALSGGPSLEKLDDPALAARLAELAAQRELTPIRGEIEGGKAEFAGLEPGLYVVTQRSRDASDGFDAIQPFLISLPRWENGSYVYDLTAAPKVPLVPAETPPPPPSEPTTPPPDDPPDIPQTGQLNWPVPVLAASGMTLFLLGWALYFGSGRKHHET